MPDAKFKESDFNEAQVKAALARSSVDKTLHRWISVGSNMCGIRLNWVRTR